MSTHPRIASNVALCLALSGLALGSQAHAATAHYTLDPDHTYPSFEADHLGGLSVWRGKFNHSRGTVEMDRAAGTGRVEVVVDLSSADFGQDKLNEVARSEQLFDVAKYPTATYRGRLTDFVDGRPTRVHGTLTLHGTTRPLDLQVRSFKCVQHPVLKRELCGADAYARFRRDAFGIDAGKDYGFDMNVTLRIQVEALRDP